MHTGTLRKLALVLTLWLALQTRWVRADQTITGNLTVTGNSDVDGTASVSGNTLELGNWTSGSTTYPGFYLGYSDGTTSASEFDAMRGANIWRWQQNGYATLKLQMTLDNSDILTIYNTSGTAGIALNPSSTGTSTLAGSLTISGTNNEMPNQTLVNSHSVLTEGLGDSRYLSSSSSGITTGSGTYYGIIGPTMGLNGGAASGPYSFAEGKNAIASGYYSTALGAYSTATGEASTAFGAASDATGRESMALGFFAKATGYAYSTAVGAYASASGSYSMALGYYSVASGGSSTALGSYATASGGSSSALGPNSTASGYYSTALGHYTSSIGLGSTAMGSHTTASGNYATASGLYTQAQAYDSFVIGYYNVGGGNATSWVGSDPLFEIGNGAPAVSASGYYIPGYYSTGSAYYTLNLQGSNSGNYTFSSYYGWLVPGPWINDPFITTSPAVPTTYSDAFVVYKNGNAVVQGSLSSASLSTTGTINTAGIAATGVITAAPGGDIPMYTGN